MNITLMNNYYGLPAGAHAERRARPARRLALRAQSPPRGRGRVQGSGARPACRARSRPPADGPPFRERRPLAVKGTLHPRRRTL